MSNVYVSNFGGDGTCLLVYTESLTAEQVEGWLRGRGFEVGDCYHVEQDQLQYYCIDERIMLSSRQDEFIRAELSNNNNLKRAIV